jgi:BirA family transcriptional regulator, biotin operon repressor / biotin---[acetyl-CoA-carboxylase] ligase
VSARGAGGVKERAADGRLIGHTIHALGAVESTQAEIARLAAAGAAEGTVVTARHQRAGRGRRGRVWWDGAGESLLLSVLLRPALPVAEAPPLTFLGALAVAVAVEAEGVTPGIRWPNDVLVDGRKLAGILAEAATTAEGRLDRVILGIGINVDQAAFPAELAERAVSLRMLTGRRHDAGRVRDRLLGALDAGYRELRAGGGAGLREAWRRRSVTLGARVRTPDGREGVAEDVDEAGALIVRAEDGSRLRVTAGEIAGAPAA